MIEFIYPFKRDDVGAITFHLIVLDYVGPGEKSCYDYHQVLIALLGFGICFQWD